MRPGLQEPAAAARMAATLDRISDGRLLINVVTGGDPVELKGDGVFLDHDERYAVTDEFLHIWRGLLAGETVTFRGQPPRDRGRQAAVPAGAEALSAALFRRLVAGRHRGRGRACRRLSHLGRAARRRRREDRRRRERPRRARAVRSRFGIRLHVIVREREEDAWRAADDLISKLDDARSRPRSAPSRATIPSGRAAWRGCMAGRRDKLVVAPNLWAGIGLVRGGAGTALVGDPDQVAERMREYIDLGIERFILSGYPHLEEAYRFAELVFPKLPLKATTGAGAA